MRLFFKHERNIKEHGIDRSLRAEQDGIGYAINFHDEGTVSLSVFWHKPEYCDFYRQLHDPTRNEIKSELARLIRHAKNYRMEVEE